MEVCEEFDERAKKSEEKEVADDGAGRYLYQDFQLASGRKNVWTRPKNEGLFAISIVRRPLSG